LRAGGLVATQRAGGLGAARYVRGVSSHPARPVPAAQPAAAVPSASPARPAQPRALIVTVYGLYAREAAGWLSVAALIRLMAGLGVDEPAVRSAISRLKQRGLLESRRVDSAAGYGLSRHGRAILAEGDRRIFDRPRASAGDGWLLAVFSVPENERSRRHTLRSRLAWLGFGTVSAGVWIAPAQLAAETRDVLDSYGLSDYVTLFRADYLAFGDVREQVGRWWDLARLEQLYQAFIDTAGPVLDRWDGPGRRAGSGPRAGFAGAASDEAAFAGAGSDEAAFADYVRVLTEWRRLPFLDPGLPAELLPDGWHGSRAAELFGRLRARLAPLAHQHALAITGRPAQDTD
jgi:phenylacetic acid degradation operon negative regulatory protein